MLSSLAVVEPPAVIYMGRDKEESQCLILSFIEETD